jgi:hypothetical protein
MIAQFLLDSNFCDVDEGKIHGARRLMKKNKKKKRKF